MATESMSMANVDIGLRSPARSKLLIHLGVILALAGVSVPLVSFAFFLLPGSLFMLPAVFSAVAATGSLLLGTGGFLIFLGLCSCAPRLPAVDFGGRRVDDRGGRDRSDRGRGVYSVVARRP
jgi:hypothetical protein